MTREEAKEMFRQDRDSYGKVKKPMTKVDEIYNDFESRTCENCMGYYHKLKVYGGCDKGVSEINIDGIELVYKKFSCNKFERK